MDDIRLLIDFGSTFTKVVAIDLDKIEVMAAARLPSTVETDITIGLETALKEIAAKTGIAHPEKQEVLSLLQRRRRLKNGLYRVRAGANESSR